jgi:8-oxo-dGTP pyrophosphatase MutT (NUDIX family)
MTEFELIDQKLRVRLPKEGDLNIDPSGPKRAAVVLMLRNRAGHAEVLIIKRAEHPQDPWSGHLALPGGRVDPGDKDLRDTAARETLEEVGIDLDAGGEILGYLNTVWPGNPRLPTIAITPLVAIAPPDAVVRANKEEVDDAFWLPLALLRQQGRSDVVQFTVHGQIRQWLAYPSSRGSIWGLTERILTQLLALLD